MYRFDEDIAVAPGESSSYTGTVTENWSVNGIPNGGYLMALLTNAMRKESTKDRIVVVTASYLSRLKPGPVELLVENFSNSTSMDRFECRLIQHDRERVRAIGTFASPTPKAVETRCEKSPPEMADLEDCIQVPIMPKYTLFDQVDARLDPSTVGWFQGKLRDRSEMKGWIRFQDERPFDPLSILLMADAFPPPILASQGVVAWVPTVELSVNLYSPPTSPWLRCAFYTNFLHQGFCQEDGEVWDDNGNLVAVSRQVAQFRKMA